MGARRDSVIRVGQQTDLELPVPRVFQPYPPVAADILLAAQRGERLDVMLQEPASGGVGKQPEGLVCSPHAERRYPLPGKVAVIRGAPDILAPQSREEIVELLERLDIS